MRGWRRRAAAGALLAAALALQGCVIGQAQQAVGIVRGADGMPAPVGVGPAAHELKRTPCACIPVALHATGRVVG